MPRRAAQAGRTAPSRGTPMRVLRVQTNPAHPDAKVDDCSGVWPPRHMLHGEAYEFSPGRHDPDVMTTIAQWVQKGTLVPLDDATAAEAMRRGGGTKRSPVPLKAV